MDSNIAARGLSSPLASWRTYSRDKCAQSGIRQGKEMPRTTLISGGGTGIGRAIATAHAKDGDQVVIAGRRPDMLNETASAIAAAVPHAPPVDTIVADVAEPSDVEKVRAHIAERYGTVAVLVNNAGGNVDLRDASWPSGLSGIAESWTANFRMNVLTAVLLTEALSDLMTAPGGRVILLSSIAAYRGSGSGSYGSVKAALHPYLYDTAARLGSRGITVNAVAPGFTDETEFFADRLTAERKERLQRQAMTGRASMPSDIAAAVRWLASPEAGNVSAQIVQVNGGAERGR
jgi:3-oxoacyl-[acyl-carrier protein] reductase